MYILDSSGVGCYASPAMEDESIVVFGFGAQGSAQALNLKDSGRRISVCLPPGSPRAAQVKEAGLMLQADAASAAKAAQIAALLIPDREQPPFYKESLEPNLPRNAALLFAHGFTVHYRQIVPRPDLDVILVAPMAQGEAVRGEFLAGAGAACLIAVAQDSTGRARERAIAYAKAMSRGGPFIDTTFAEEVESDLFAEQAVLCGGLPELVRAAFDTLVKKGCNPDIAYHCCLKELKAIVALLDRHAIAGMRLRISDTARYGAYTRGPRVIDEHARAELARILEEIRSGAFAREFTNDRQRAKAVMDEGAKRDGEHLIERIHKKYSLIAR